MSNVEGNTTVMSILLAEVATVLQNSSKFPVIVAIEGKCGSGKTFYGSKLAAHFNASLIHCDDFFLPKQLRTPERLAEVGGNIHYERLRQLLSRLQSEQMPLTYLAYNCSTDSYEQRSLVKSNLIVVEGSYALHPTLADFYNLKILLTVDNQTQKQRLLIREGEQGIVNFINKWIPLENRYFDALDTTDCTVIDTTKYETN